MKDDREPIAFNQPTIEGRELFYIAQSVLSRNTSGSGQFTVKVRELFAERLAVQRRQVALTPSCTAALEMAAVLCELDPGDEVIMPSFTFTSTANAFVLRDARPVFVDIRPDTLNIDERLIEAAITPRTKAIVPVHYAGVSCEMDPILEVARRRGLRVVEDAAQAVGSTYKGRPCGALGDLGAFSFHETKVFSCGEGGALVVGDPSLVARAEVIAEKGTDRSAFFRGEVDKYTWRDVGSSYLMADLCAAFLLGQLERWDEVVARRRAAHDRYHARLGALAERGVRLPTTPAHCATNSHIFYLLTNDLAERGRLIAYARERGVQIIFHYVPLHESPFGEQFHRGRLPVTEDLSRRLVRLPLHNSMQLDVVERVCDVVLDFYGAR